MRYTRFFLMALAFLAITALAACGGSDDPGGSGSGWTSTSPPSQVTPASPTTVSGSQASSTRTSSTPSQASTSASTPSQASTSTPGSTPTGASTSESTVAAPGPTSPLEPTASPARVVAPGLVNSRSCEEEFREMLANYDGPERFDVKLINSLSDEFVGLRPDCLAQGWDPEFVQETQVCYDWEDNPNSIMEKGNRYDYISPTQWVVSKGRIGDLEGRTTIHINVHLYRFPLTSEIPSRMNYSPGELVGGCWSYKGWRGPDGQSYGWWGRSFFKYVLTSSGKAARNRVFSSGGKSSVVERSITSSYPGCDTLLQAALSEELDDGRAVNLAGVDELIEQVRVTAGVACAAEWATFLTWQPSPVDGPSAACPFGSSTGLQADGFFVVNWPDGHFDLYGDSACWVRSPEGEWGAYLSSEDGPPRPAARAVEDPSEPDRESLMVLYRALGGNRWGSSFNVNWATDAPIDRWEGVRVKDGRVVALKLAGAGLRGEIPAEIAGLTALEELDLGDNQLTGEIPPELWGLSHLVELELNDNGLTGEVPAGIADLTKLRTLDLRGNDLTGCLPAGMRDHLDRNSSGYGLDFCN
jgi:hypothetical protein